MTWVHLANLKGPKGDVGPVNVGVSGVTAVGTALRFSFTDGRTPQDVNLPLATSTSAGLQAPLRDTGWIDVTAGASTVASGQIRLRRQGSRVTIVINQVRMTAVGTHSLPRLSDGFRPQFRVRALWFPDHTASVVGTLNISPDGYFNIYGSDGRDIFARIEFDTAQPWPTT